MKKFIKRHIWSLSIFTIVWVYALLTMLTANSTYEKHLARRADEATFGVEAEVIENKDKVGANIWLKQAIHGLDGIKYRYVIETDCPKWDFETRYMTDAPIDWIDETSAVEVIIYDTQIRYNGTVYASGQYYTVPILGGISSENISQDAWKDNLMAQAYQTYLAEGRMNSDFSLLLKSLLFGTPIVAGVWLGMSEALRICGQCEKLPTNDIMERLESTVDKLREESTDSSSDNQSEEKKE